MSDHARVKVEDAPVIARLIDEAFPNHFTITIAFGRDKDGKLPTSGACEVFARPSTQEEELIVFMLAAAMRARK